LFPPESFGISLRGFIHFAVLFERSDVGFLAEFFWRRDWLFFQDVGIEFLHDSSVIAGSTAMKWPTSGKYDIRKAAS
jgi:hypothetical protein